MPELSYREAVRDALATAMRRDDDVFIMGEDIAEMGGSMGVTQGLLDEFGAERVRNTPISEIGIVGAGIGAAMQGMRPVVEIMYEDFLTLSAEQIVNQAAKHRYMSGGQLKVPLTIRTQGGAGWSPGAQHAQQLESWFVHIPGLKVVFASTPTDVRGLLYSAIYEDNPVIFFEHRTLYGLKEEMPDELEHAAALVGVAEVKALDGAVVCYCSRSEQANGVRCDATIGIEKDDGVGWVLAQMTEAEVEGEALAAVEVVGAFDGLGAALPRDGSGEVRAVISNHEDVCAGGKCGNERQKCGLDDGLLVVGRNEDGEVGVTLP